MLLRLKIFQPSEVFLDEEVSKVVAEGEAGSFGIRPRHLDITSALVPGLLSYWTGGGKETFLAVNGGILVKQGEDVFVATRMAVSGELGMLNTTVEKFLSDVDEKDRKSRSAVAKLEADFIRRFLEFGKDA
jgi:F-type H+-transporting ATPase subunit epsilon